jgi:hypothetical protein
VLVIGSINRKRSLLDSPKVEEKDDNDSAIDHEQDDHVNKKARSNDSKSPSRSQHKWKLKVGKGANDAPQILAIKDSVETAKSHVSVSIAIPAQVR